MKRKSLSKKTRFEVFKRDNFRCQYCGRGVPEVILQVDHIKPVKEGGDISLLNLITCCFDCNHGKKARELEDTTVPEKQEAELSKMFDEFREKQAIAKLREEVLQQQEYAKEMIQKEILFLTNDKYTLNNNGILKALKSVKKFGLKEYLESLNIAFENDYRENDNNTDNFEQAFEKAPKIAATRKLVREKPYMQDLFYIRGIARNRFRYFIDWQAIQILEDAYKSGVSIRQLKEIALSARNWSDWTALVCEEVRRAGREH